MTARMIWVWMTATWRGGVLRRFGRKASIARPARRASGGRRTACRISSRYGPRSPPGTEAAAAAERIGGSCGRGRPGRAQNSNDSAGVKVSRVRTVGSSECHSFLDLLLEPADKPVACFRRVTARAERIVPLLVGEALELLADRWLMIPETPQDPRGAISVGASGGNLAFHLRFPGPSTVMPMLKPELMRYDRPWPSTRRQPEEASGAS